MAAPQRQGRRISLEAHRIAEMAIGLLLIVFPVILNFQIAGFVLCAGSGALLVALGIAATREGRRLSGVSHRSADLVLAGLLVVAAVVSAAVNTTAGPTVTLAVAALAQAALTAVTRYAESPPG